MYRITSLTNKSITSVAKFNFSTENNKIESIERKRSRLIYQSRKRGMLENCILLSYFANKYINEFDSKKLDQYDFMINSVSNDWDLYYWAMGTKEVPKEFDNEVFHIFKDFVANNEKELRNQQPEIVDVHS